MPSSYTPLLRLTLPADGELVGTWGQTVNNGITSLEEAAIAGTAGVGLVDADYVMTTANGAADVARNAVVRFTGALSAQRAITVPSSSKTYFIRNATTGGFGLLVKTAAGTGVVVPAGGAMLLYCDGVNVLQAIDVSGAITVTDINGTPDLILKSSGTEKMRINSSGNVLVGTATSSGVGLSRLEVASTAGSSQILASSPSASIGLYAGGAGVSYLQWTDGAVLSFLTGPNNLATSTERMRIDAAGNVGIGTAPTYKLQILVTPPTGLGVFRDVDAAAATAGVFLDLGARVGATQTPGVQLAGVIDNGASGFLTISTRTAGALTEKMRIDAVGNVLVKATTSVGGGDARLQVGSTNVASQVLVKSNTAHLALYASSLADSYVVTAPAGFLAFGHGPADVSTFTERMRIDAAGNILIANTGGAPAVPPGGVIYVEGGALKYRGSSGTITVLAPA